MVDTERALLYIGIGFLGTLFIMKSVRFLRPASSASMSLNLPNSITRHCDSCKGNPR